MKNENQIRTSRDAALRRARSLARNMFDDIELLEMAKTTPEAIMPRLRHQLAELNQRVHEFNAYHNCLCA